MALRELLGHLMPTVEDQRASRIDLPDLWIGQVGGVVIMSPGSPPGTKMIGASGTLSRSVNV